VHHPWGVLGLQIGIGVAATIGILVLYSQGQELWKVAMATIAASTFLMGSAVERKYLTATYDRAKAGLFGG